MAITPTVVNACHIPNITTLRRALSYDPHLGKAYRTFTRDLKHFRLKYRTARGVCVGNIYQWKPREGRAVLAEAADAFLEKEEKGSLYWPDDKTDEFYNGLSYSTNKD